MPSQGTSTLPRRLSAVVATFALAAASLLLTASPASAHDRLLGSDPAAGATVDQLPAVLTLTFSAAIATDEGASEIVVTDAAGATLAEGAPVVDGPLLTQAVSDPTAAGDVTVLWKVVSSDGHPISGEIVFTVSSVPEPTPTETAEPSPTEEPVETAAPAEPTQTPTSAPVDSENASDSSATVPWIIAGVLAVLVIGASAYLIASRARRRKASAQTPPAESDAPSER